MSEEQKNFSEEDYTRISREGGDPNEDGFITNDEWTNWMLSKGPDEGFEEDYKRKYPNSTDPVRFEVNSGRKYLKINQIDGGVHAFVNKETGEVFKPASWKSPAKHVRYDLRIINDRERCFSNADWAGGYLYLR